MKRPREIKSREKIEHKVPLPLVIGICSALAVLVGADIVKRYFGEDSEEVAEAFDKADVSEDEAKELHHFLNERAKETEETHSSSDNATNLEATNDLDQMLKEKDPELNRMVKEGWQGFEFSIDRNDNIRGYYNNGTVPAFSFERDGDSLTGSIDDKILSGFLGRIGLTPQNPEIHTTEELKVAIYEYKEMLEWYSAWGHAGHKAGGGGSTVAELSVSRKEERAELLQTIAESRNSWVK